MKGRSQEELDFFAEHAKQPEQTNFTSTKGFVLEEETPVRLRLNRTISSADAHVGDTLDFEVLDDISVNGTLVIPKGGVAFATVTEAQAKRRMARGESNPSGADIDLDGSFVGNTPSDVQVTEGEHTVSVKKKGFKELGAEAESEWRKQRAPRGRVGKGGDPIRPADTSLSTVWVLTNNC